jgi:hypothetical protein
MPHALTRLVAVVIVAVSLASAAPAHAVDRLVPSQFPTITLAVSASLAGDTILISPGVYNECVVLAALGSVNVLGKRGAIIDASGCGTALTILSGTGIVVKGLTITNATTGILVLAAASEVIVNKTEIIDPAVDPGLSDLDVGVHVIGAGNVTLDNVDIKGAKEQAVLVEAAAGTVVKKSSIIDGAGEGVRVDLGTAAKIEKNTFENLLGPAIRFFHEGGVGLLGGAVESLVVSNKVLNSPGGGIVIAGANNLIEKNKVVKSGANGVVALATGGSSIYRKNKVGNATEAGIVVAGDQNLFEKNTVKLAGGPGFEVTGSDNLVVGGKSIESAGSGFFVGASASDNEFELCAASKSGVDGFHVEGSLNTFFRSQAAGSKGLDLNDVAGNATNNDYVDCKFKTSNVSL